NLTVFLSPESSPTAIYPLSLHDALPIWHGARAGGERAAQGAGQKLKRCTVLYCTRMTFKLFAAVRRSFLIFNFSDSVQQFGYTRSEEHTSELQSRRDLVCRLLLEKKKNK